MSVFGARNPRRLLAWMLIAQQLFVGTGIALPCSVAAAGSTERYPCEKCGCGCRSAEQCWAQCCCFTNQQKIAWARQHGVAVPEFVVAAAKREAAAAEKPKCPHCDRRAVPKIAVSSPDARTRSDREQRNDEQRPSGKICWLDALRCHGLTEQWQATTPIWPSDPHVELCLVLLPVGRVEPQPVLRHLFCPSAPPTPPPKKVSAGTVTAPVLS